MRSDHQTDRPADGDHDLGVPHVGGQYFHQIEQAPGLGRHVLHDARSRDYDADSLVTQVTREATTYHQRVVPPWDQGEVGACTAFAALGLMMTEPFVGAHSFTEQDALRFYSEETRLDDRQIPGEYPPDDTGSTGLWSMKVLRNWLLIPGYKHAFSIGTVKRLLQVAPVSFGFAWYQSMFEVDRHGFLKVDTASGLAGGHQLDGTAVDYERQAVKLTNSWGPDWGLRGEAFLRFSDLETLLRLHGDCAVPTGRLD